MTVNKFSVSLEEIAERTNKTLEQTIRSFVMDLFRKIIFVSPVDTGRFRANWNATVSGPNFDYDWNKVEDRGNLWESVIRSAPLTGENVSFYLCNGLPYASVLEYGLYPNPPKYGTWLKTGERWGEYEGPGYVQKSQGGFSKRAPQGMIRVTVAEFQTYLDKALAK